MKDLEAILPHRAPFLWVDRILHLEPGSYCLTSKRIDPAAPFFAGHFPDNPILPGVFLVEATAQTAGVMLAAAGGRRGSQALLGAIRDFRFLRPVRPGEVIEVETRTLVHTGGVALVAGVIRVDREVVATGQVSVVSS